jgi:hypothetical protein
MQQNPAADVAVRMSSTGADVSSSIDVGARVRGKTKEPTGASATKCTGQQPGDPVLKPDARARRTTPCHLVTDGSFRSLRDAAFVRSTGIVALGLEVSSSRSLSFVALKRPVAQDREVLGQPLQLLFR